MYVKPENERSASWYDGNYDADLDFHNCHYTRAPSYPAWCIIADRMRREAPGRILDLGCGSGQLACLLRDKGFKNYLGVDFSARKIERARAICPEFTFSLEGLYDCPALKEKKYDTVIAAQVFEHILHDLDVIREIPRGVKCHITVPNVESMAHVRHFPDRASVIEHYKSFFYAKSFSVTGVLINPAGKIHFLAEGIRK